ncbi:unnamed protein product [Hymenolepis diminuta]|uniref:Abhydrolase_2 domain-containing protein n=1 Tax=Hymenolepis diminuta TaxID=6216 RepID=A0A0R3SA16_HYMDI|nr:unnamed protein product [Hymenolepis diminuta]
MGGSFYPTSLLKTSWEECLLLSKLEHSSLTSIGSRRVEPNQAPNSIASPRQPSNNHRVGNRPTIAFLHGGGRPTVITRIISLLLATPASISLTPLHLLPPPHLPPPFDFPPSTSTSLII